MRVVALGRTQWLFEAIKRCVARGHEVVLIATAPAAPEYLVNEHDFARLAKSLGCSFFCDPHLSSYKDLLHQANADIAVSANWPGLIRKPILDLFPKGILNYHCGDLPRFRGNACPNWAILAEEKQVVLTVHQMVESLDAGPIIVQDRFALCDTTYIGDVYAFLNRRAPELLAEAVDELERETFQPRLQLDNPALSLRCFPRVPGDGHLDWSQPAAQLGRLVRASAEPFAGAFTFWEGRRLTIWRARPAVLPYPWLGSPGQLAEVNSRLGEVVVLTGKDVLILESISLDGEMRKRASDVLGSTRIRLGLDISQLAAALAKQWAMGVQSCAG